MHSSLISPASCRFAVTALATFLSASDALSRSSAKLPEPPRWFAITDLRLGIDIILLELTRRMAAAIFSLRGTKLSELTCFYPRLVISCNSFLARIDIISNNYP